MSIPCASKFYVGPDGITWREPGEDRYPVREDFRPLVVLDPEDREQVERLESAYLADEHDDCEDPTDCMRDALRSLLAPPKPDEPTGLGAVVEDAEGADWHRTREGRWIAVDGLRSRASGWTGVDVARVLSEGVQS